MVDCGAIKLILIRVDPEFDENLYYVFSFRHLPLAPLDKLSMDELIDHGSRLLLHG
jgi:hypothetical protein